ncbi:glutamate---cysteine ligase [Synchytrium endobioticum]|uniref:Glutamate--cysteine ligase n=1 Tax=Synchytrium endobioticum TaxID=286115 RepID=A0A507CFA7_9FUNG|nr:glutamate---cysteine ligase [Synchytrium endobioticum]TPX47301.1 glutamate---cysteine ligase [Synchytrium endobioticum]
MGLLSLGTPLRWNDAHQYADHVRKHGIIQLLNIWQRLKTRRRDHLIWGDEVEYIVVALDHDLRKASVSLAGYDGLLKLQAMEASAMLKGLAFNTSWKPEYGKYMLEGTPGLPFAPTLVDLLGVEDNMKTRRLLAQSVLGTNNAVLTLVNFPRLGCPNFSLPPASPAPFDGKASRSLFIPDDAINPHPRFSTLTANIRERRQSKVSINLPIYHDSNTPRPFLEPLPPSLSSLSNTQIADVALYSCSDSHNAARAARDKVLHLDPSLPLPSLPDIIPDAKPDHVYLDAMCFGMGCCCLQLTFQACSVEEARRLYDQLAVISPIMLAITAACPIFRGYLTDVDCRWNTIAASVDDRTKEERGVEPLSIDKYRIAKSRYDSIDSYLSPGPNYSGGCSSIELDDGVNGDRGNGFFHPKYNDIPLVFDEQIRNQLLEGGMDDLLAQHFAHLFIRDPLVVFRELLDQDDHKSSDHFENIQSTNWQTMRFKPPPVGQNIGWRVEFRSMEVQLTDYENAAYALFVVLLTRTILSFDLNFYLPISKVDDNLQRAQKRNAAMEETFWFRKHVMGNPDVHLPMTNGTTIPSSSTNGHVSDDSYEEMTMAEIFNGKPASGFAGLISLVEAYLASAKLDFTTITALNKYVGLVRAKSTGQLPTTATWIRQFIMSHPSYNHDSVVNEDITYDLCKTVHEFAHCEGRVPGLNC